MGRFGGSTLFGGPAVEDFFDPLLGLGEITNASIHDAPEQFKLYSGAAATTHNISLDNIPALGALVLLGGRFPQGEGTASVTAPSDALIVGERSRSSSMDAILWAAIADGTATYRDWTVSIPGTASFRGVLFEWRTDKKWARLADVCEMEDEFDINGRTTVDIGPTVALKTPNELVIDVLALSGTVTDAATSWTNGFRSPGYGEGGTIDNARISSKVTKTADPVTTTATWVTSRTVANIVCAFREQKPSLPTSPRRVPRQLVRAR